ncbi:MAG: hypothetical protein WKF59_01380 [Chitinophagaceae bacterium]
MLAAQIQNRSFVKHLHWAGMKQSELIQPARTVFILPSQIAEVAKQNNYDLIFTGKETIDYNGSSIGGMVAELLDMPYVSLATKFILNGTTATINREIEGGEEVNEVQLPVVVSCQKGVAEQRIPNMKGIMGARTKPLKVVEPAAS